jgi:superfamily II DNA/RNA helicase
MDLPDIKLVIQWKATCDFCTLWQRFGRAGRGQDQEAVALLLVEQKDTDEARKKKAERAEKARQKKREGIGTKRKEPADGRQDAQSSKRRALLDRGQNSRTSEDVIDSASDGDESDAGDGEMGTAAPGIRSSRVTDNDEVRRLKYSEISRSNVPTPKQDRGVEVGSAMDDYINAKDRGISCRRVVSTLYFGNDKTRKLPNSPTLFRAHYP